MNKEQILEAAKESGLVAECFKWCEQDVRFMQVVKFAEIILAKSVPDGWRLYTADNSMIDKCSVMFMRTDVKAWHDQHDTYGEAINADEPPLYIQGIGKDFFEAFSDAAMRAKEAKPLIADAPKGTDK